MNKEKKGFTLVELLAVIAVLALILIIAVPKITKTMENSKKRTLELSAKSIAKSAETKYHENKTFGVKEEITCETVTNMSKKEYESCIIEFDNEGNATVTIKGKGSYKGLNVCDGTKEDVTISNNRCRTLLTVTLDGGTSSVDNSGEYKVGSTVTLTEPTKEGYTFNGWSVTGATINGNTLTIGSNDISVTATWVKLISFNIGGTTYQAEEGMTWVDWVDTAYNTDGLSLYYSYVAKGLGGDMFVVAFGYNAVSNTELIIEGKQYSMSSPGSLD